MAGAGAAPNTATLAFGGGPGTKAVTESWNGTNWTEVNDLNTARRYLSGIGATNTAAIAFAGYNGSNYVGITELWNGTNWTEVNDMTRPSQYGFGGDSGSSTAGLAAGGYSPGVTANTELWNGTNWAEQNNLNTGRGYSTGCGTTTASLVACGSPTDQLIQMQ